MRSASAAGAERVRRRRRRPGAPDLPRPTLATAENQAASSASAWPGRERRGRALPARRASTPRAGRAAPRTAPRPSASGGRLGRRAAARASRTILPVVGHRPMRARFPLGTSIDIGRGVRRAWQPQRQRLRAARRADDVVRPAARLVAVVRHAPDDDERVVRGGRAAADHALGAGGVLAAHGADGGQLGDLVGEREQGRHGVERPAQEVLVEAGHEHAPALGREQLADLGQARHRRTGPRRWRRARPARRSRWPGCPTNRAPHGAANATPLRDATVPGGVRSSTAGRMSTMRRPAISARRR